MKTSIKGVNEGVYNPHIFNKTIENAMYKIKCQYKHVSV